MSKSEHRFNLDYEQFDDVMDLLERGLSDVVPERPSDDLWGRIDAEIKTVDQKVNPAEPLVNSPAELAGVTDLSQRRSSKLAYMGMGVAAAVVGLVLLPLGLAWNASQNGSVQSVAQLAELQDFTGDGTATLRGSELELEVSSLPKDNNTFYELWAIDIEDGQIEDLTSLGRVDGSGTFEWPESIDPAEYSVIDISIEPDDGNPEHSGASVLQGELNQA